MGCCLLAAIVIGRWLTLWDGLRRWRPRLSRNARLFIGAEVLALGLLAFHGLGGGPDAIDTAVCAAAVAGQQDGPTAAARLPAGQ